MSFWGRRRDIAALVAVVVLQLVLLGYQVRRDDDVTLLRAWSVGAVSPVNKLLHAVVGSSAGFWNRYVWLVGAQDENERMRAELERLRLENEDLRREVEQLGRVESLAAYQRRLASETVSAEVIGGGAGTRSREIILNRGRRDGIRPGAAVVVADGVVGKVQAAYPGSALVLLITDPDAGIGAILGDSRVRGIGKGLGESEIRVDYVAHEVKVRESETVYTSGDDRVFPKGLRIGGVTRIERGADFHEIYVEPFAKLDRLDQVLVVTAGVHEPLPPRRRRQVSETLLAPPLEDELAPAAPHGVEPDDEDPMLTDADRLKMRYRGVAAAQDVEIGEMNPGGRTPDFNAGHPSAAQPQEPPSAVGPGDPR